MMDGILVGVFAVGFLLAAVTGSFGEALVWIVAGLQLFRARIAEQEVARLKARTAEVES